MLKINNKAISSTVNVASLTLNWNIYLITEIQDFIWGTYLSTCTSHGFIPEELASIIYYCIRYGDIDTLTK